MNQWENWILLCALVSHSMMGLPTPHQPLYLWRLQHSPAHLNATGKPRKKKYMLIPAQFRQLHQADHSSVGTTAFKPGHAGKSTRRHEETQLLNLVWVHLTWAWQPQLSCWWSQIKWNKQSLQHSSAQVNGQSKRQQLSPPPTMQPRMKGSPDLPLALDKRIPQLVTGCLQGLQCGCFEAH